MAKTWIPINFETAPGGVSSAVSPDLLTTNQFPWAMNMSVRGGKLSTRPSMACRHILPSGLFQGGSYFSVQDGMLVIQIDGISYRIRIGVRDFSHEAIVLPWYNSPIIKQVYMQQTVETLIIQDGQSNAILYNGSVARRAGALEVPLGRQMAYGNGRLWVAVGNKRLLAGDIRTNTAGSELKFTEVNYLSGGGALYFPQGINGLAFIPTTGTTDYGALLVLGEDYTNSVRADITSRDDWQSYPGFVTNVLRNVGTSSAWSITPVNQDLYWRDSLGGIRSLRASLVDESGPGNTPLSREVSRLVDYDSQSLLEYCSGIFLNNRLLMTSSPYLNKSGGVSHKNLVSLDFAPVSTMQGKGFPAYNGQWNGVHFAKIFSGKFSGQTRGFGVSCDEDGINRLWEFDVRDRTDISISCGSTGAESLVESPVVAVSEYPLVNFGDGKVRKRLESCRVWISELRGDVQITAYWRTDNAQKWTQWDQVEACAKVEDPATNEPHSWKNLLPEQRPQIQTFTIPDGVDAITKYALHIGFQFQLRLKIVGRCKVERAMLGASGIEVQDYATRESLTAECIQNDVTGNEINYRVPIYAGCAQIKVSIGSSGSEIAFGETSDFGDTDSTHPILRDYTITNTGGGPLILGTLTLLPNSGFQIISQPSDVNLLPGEMTTFRLKLVASSPGAASATVLIPNNSLDYPIFNYIITGNVIGGIFSLSYASRGGNVTYAGFFDPRFLPTGATIGTVSSNGSQATWSSINTYNSYQRVYYSGKFYQSKIDGNLNQRPDLFPLLWNEVDPVIYWLASTLSGTAGGCTFNATTNCSGANFTVKTPDYDVSGTTTITHTGTLTPGYTTVSWSNPASFSTPCIRTGTSTVFVDDTISLGAIANNLRRTNATSSQAVFDPDPACVQSAGNSSKKQGAASRTFSTREDPYNYLTPNGSLTTSNAGTWATVSSQTGAQISQITFGISNLIHSQTYQLTVNYAASSGVIPDSTIIGFSSDGSGNASIPLNIPFGSVSSDISLASYQLDQV